MSGIVVAGTAAEYEHLVASAAAGTEAVCGDSWQPAQARPPARGLAHQDESNSPLTEPAEREPGVCLPSVGRLAAACWVAEEEGCAGWLHSGRAVLWMGRTAAGSASVLRAGLLEE